MRMIEARRGLTPPRRATAAADHNSSGMAVSPWRICRHRSKRERTSSMLGVRELRPQVFECLPPTLPAKERPYHPCANFHAPLRKTHVASDEDNLDRSRMTPQCLENHSILPKTAADMAR